MTTRRLFLKQGLFATAGLSLLAQARMAEAAAPSNRVVIFLYLFGGNDGLNTVVPMNQYTTYESLRPTLKIPKGRLLVPDTAKQIGFNPGMTKLFNRFTSNGTGKANVAVLNGVAMPEDSVGLFDHAGCQYVYQTCDIKQVDRATDPAGWFGEYFKTSGYAASLTGVDLGGSPVPLQYIGYVPTSITSVNDFVLTPNISNISPENDALKAAYSAMYGSPKSIPASTSAIAEYNRTTRVQALSDSVIVQAATSGYKATPDPTDSSKTIYPNTSLGNSFKTCAQLLYGDLGIRSITIGVGGWDTHEKQNDGALDNPSTGYTLGNHDKLLQGVSDAIDAFFVDLETQGLAEDVLLITMSDFGRNATENSSFGTDHGYSSVAFAVGKTVKGGVYNDYPDLTQLVYTNKLSKKSDFRSVYSTIAAKFLGANPVLVTGGDFPLMGFLG
jgi:uncharacterized protein (DUF1501 family)